MEPLKEANAIKSEISRVIANTAYQTYEKRLLKEVKEHEVPHHVAVIMDGNRRFAKGFGLTPRRASQREGQARGGAGLAWAWSEGADRLRFQHRELRARRGGRFLDADVRRKLLSSGKDERVHRHGIKVRVLGQRDLLPEKYKA